VRAPLYFSSILYDVASRGVVGRGRGGGRRPPTFFRQGDRGPPLPPLFWTEIRAKVSPLLQLVTY